MASSPPREPACSALLFPNQMTTDLPLEDADLRLGSLSEMGLQNLLGTLTGTQENSATPSQ